MKKEATMEERVSAKAPPVGIWAGLIKTQQKNLKNLFSTKKSLSNVDQDILAIPHLSVIANSVVSRCSRILQIPAEELQDRFGTPVPKKVTELPTYARNFIEFCSYQTLHELTKSPDYLSDKEFRRLTFDMMLAWDSPSPKSKPVENDASPSSDREVEDDSGWSLFSSSSNNMAVQVDEEKKTVGPEAFARIAPACAVVADVITVHNLFNALTSSSKHLLHFLLYDKYIRSLDKVIKFAKNASLSSSGNLHLPEGEFVLDIDGTVPFQPILQHIGLAAWPGKLTLTNYALYFEPLGVGSYEKAVKYDLATDLKQVIKPDLTGPLGARVFDTAVMYKSTSTADPVYMELTELKGNSRRDYWLDICLEILYTHRFIRRNNLKEIEKSEVLARAILGIFRYHAVREAFQFSSSHYKTLLPFNLAETLPGGDLILETLLVRLNLLNSDSEMRRSNSGSPNAKQQPKLSPTSLLALQQFGLVLQKDVHYEEGSVGDVCVGEINPLEESVKQSMSDTFSAEAAQATVDRVKVEGIDTNITVMKELLFPALAVISRVQLFASWEDPYKSAGFLVLLCWSVISAWIKYVLPCIFLYVAGLMLWKRHFNKGKPLEPFKVKSPPNQNAVEQLLTLQDAINQLEALIQGGNIVLLKIRALIFAVLPQATDKVVLLLVVLAGLFAFLPFRYIPLLVFIEYYTREMPYRKESSDKLVRRVREWWVRIPAAPVQLVKRQSSKKKKA